MKQEPKKQRGVYERDPGSGVWWIRYSDASGRIRREIIGTKSAAIRLYRKRKTEVLEGKKLPSDLRSITRIEDIAPALARDYRINNRKSIDSAERRLNLHLLPHFAKRIASEVTPSDIAGYVDKRKSAGAANATINRELAALKRIFNLAKSNNQINELPKFPKRLEENAPRTGFIEEPQYRKLLSHADELWLKAVLATAYTFGFRRSELLNLRVRNIDLLGKRISLDAGTTKNKKARLVVMTPEVAALIELCIYAKTPDDFVFTRDGNRAVLSFKEGWYVLCEKAQLGRFVKVDGKLKWKGLLFHDLRRSAVRNMVRAGIPESVAMKISGHKTRSVFERYNITAEDDLKDAALRLSRVQPTSTSTDTSSKTARDETQSQEIHLQSGQ